MSNGERVPPAPPGLVLRPLTAGDHPDMRRLWGRELSPEVLGLSAADGREPVGGFLERNPGLSWGLWTADGDRRLVGSVLAGHDGRRGYLYHLIVAPEWRRQGLGGLLVRVVIVGLLDHGIGKMHAYVYTANEDARAFWHRLGFLEREELVVVSREISELPHGGALHA